MFRRRPRLRDKERREKERVSGKFDYANFAVRAGPADNQSGLFKPFAILGIKSVGAIVGLGDKLDAIQRRGQRAFCDRDRLLLAHKRTGQRCDDKVTAHRVSVLFMTCVLDPEDVARELDDRVLKAPSGADERHATLARKADRGDGAVHAPIWTSRRDQETVETVQRGSRVRFDPIGRHLFVPEPGVLERAVGESMRRVGEVQIADDADQGLARAGGRRRCHRSGPLLTVH